MKNIEKFTDGSEAKKQSETVLCWAALSIQAPDQRSPAPAATVRQTKRRLGTFLGTTLF
jgi:hypothetical protein